MSLSGEGEVGGTVLLAKAQWENGAVRFCKHVPPFPKTVPLCTPQPFPAGRAQRLGKRVPKIGFTCLCTPVSRCFLSTACSPSQTWAGDFCGDGTSMAGPRLSGTVTLDGSHH